MGNQEMIRKCLVDLGQRLGDVRIELRVPKQEMAAALEIEPGYLADLESGKVIPGADFFIKLADKYNVNPNYLLLGIGDLILKTDHSLSGEDIDLESDIDSMEKFVLLMNISPYFKARILASASLLLFEDSGIIRRSIQKYKSIKETKNE